VRRTAKSPWPSCATRGKVSGELKFPAGHSCHGVSSKTTGLRQRPASAIRA
jgi:hypothetical protein